MARFTIKMKAGKEAEICLYDVIDQWGGISAKDFRRELAAAGDVDVIHCRINSPGGSVWDGLAIHNTLKAHKAKVIVHVDGVAASMASIVAMAGDEIEMPANAFLMLHNPSDIAAGDAEEIRKTANLLDQVKDQLAGIYAGRCGKSVDEIGKLMDAETWLDGKTAVEMGLATKCLEPLATAASIDKGRLANYRNLPATLTSSAAPPLPKPGAKTMADTTVTEPKPATLKELRAACPGADEKFLLAQIEAESTLAVASTAWMTAQAKLLDNLTKELKAAKSGKPGVKPPTDKGKGKKAEKDEDEAEDDNDEDTQNSADEDPDMDDLLGDDPIGKFDSLVTAAIKKQAATGRPVDRMKAVQTVAAKNPAIHHAYLVASNGGRKVVKRILGEKFEGITK